MCRRFILKESLEILDAVCKNRLVLFAVNITANKGTVTLCVTHLAEHTAVRGGDTLDCTHGAIRVPCDIHGRIACKIGILECNLTVLRQIVNYMLRRDKTAFAMRNSNRVQIANLAGGQPRALDRCHARGHITALVATDQVEGQRRIVASHLVADLAVGHKPQLDERLEAVADTEHQTIALAEQFMNRVLDAGAAQERSDELARAIRLVTAGKTTRHNDHLSATNSVFPAAPRSVQAHQQNSYVLR